MNGLNDINKKNNFKVPENYFENFSQELEIRISEENLKKKFGNKTPFTVPENYFENFKTNIPEKRQNTFAKIIKITKPWLSAAAGIIIIFTLWNLLITRTVDSETSANNTETSTDYIPEEIIDEIDINTIYEISNENNEPLTNTENETITNYIIDYSDDYEYAELIAEL